MKSKRRYFVASAAALVLLAAAAVCFAYTMPQPNDFIDVSKRTEVDCKKVMQGRTMVALAFGQSNSANHSESPFKPKKNVYNFYEGKCYVAEDPMLGATGEKGSVWSRLGEKLIDRGMYDNVLFVTIGVGGTEVKRWTHGGDLHLRIDDVLRQLKKKNIKITHMFWHQGEADKNLKTTKDDYKKMFIAMLDDIRKKGVEAPIYVSVATRCGGGEPSYEIQQAQKELVNTELKIFPGPDTDQLASLDDRNDACHFSNAGLDKHSEMWVRTIKFSGQ